MNTLKQDIEAALRTVLSNAPARTKTQDAPQELIQLIEPTEGSKVGIQQWYDLVKSMAEAVGGSTLVSNGELQETISTLNTQISTLLHKQINDEAQINSLKADINWYKTERDEAAKIIQRYSLALEEAQSIISSTQWALRYYADESNYKQYPSVPLIPIIAEAGAIARKVSQNSEVSCFKIDEILIGSYDSIAATSPSTTSAEFVKSTGDPKRLKQDVEQLTGEPLCEDEVAAIVELADKFNFRFEERFRNWVESGQFIPKQPKAQDEPSPVQSPNANTGSCDQSADVKGQAINESSDALGSTGEQDNANDGKDDTNGDQSSTGCGN